MRDRALAEQLEEKIFIAAVVLIRQTADRSDSPLRDMRLTALPNSLFRPSLVSMSGGVSTSHALLSTTGLISLSLKPSGSSSVGLHLQAASLWPQRSAVQIVEGADEMNTLLLPRSGV